MKKYFLLAGTALLISGQAWAASVSADGQSATMTVSATLANIGEIISAQDMSFGTIVVLPSRRPTSLTKISTLDAESGEVTLYSDFAKGQIGTATRGIVNVTDDLEIALGSSAAFLSFTCGAGSLDGSGCQLTGGSSGTGVMYVKDFNVHAGSCGANYIGASLYANSNTTNVGSYSGTITVSVDY